MGSLIDGQKVLIIRYGKKVDCVEKHSEIINKNGFCWFGKIGTVPSKKAISAIFAEKQPMIVLHSQGKYYLAEIEQFQKERPMEGFPEYYKTELFDESIYPSCYFKMTSIKPLKGNEIAKLRIASSGNAASETLGHSMSSFFFAEYGKKGANGKTGAHNVIHKNTESKHIKEKCIYLKEGRCSRKGFVNYMYECERPDSCAGQKN